MAWIESHQTLREHPKTYALMDALGVEKATALGHLQMFWWWCIDYALDGILEANPAQLSRAADWKGDANVFAEAMLKAGWIDAENGKWSVHDWHEFTLHYNLSQQKKETQRQQVRERVKKWRDKQKNGNARANKRNASVTQCNAPTVPNRTVPNLTVHNPTEPKENGKDIAPLRAANRSPHVLFVEGFKSVYQEVTGAPFKVDQKHWVIAASLVKAHGTDECVKKAKTLGVLCRDRSAWFTKDGFASFTLETLSSKWNSIIPESIPPTEKDQLLAELKKREEMRVRGDAIIANGSK